MNRSEVHSPIMLNRAKAQSLVVASIGIAAQILLLRQFTKNVTTSRIAECCLKLLESYYFVMFKEAFRWPL